mgnify:CR=1 FL=1
MKLTGVSLIIAIVVSILFVVACGGGNVGDAPAAAVQELERRLRINDDVMRHMTIKVEELSDEPSPIIARKDRDDRRRKD